MKQIFFLGQAPARPSSKHDVPGTYLHNWLYGIGFTDEDILNNCHFFALMARFPGTTKGGHLTPTRLQIEIHRPVLVKAIQSIQPEMIVPVGKMAISEVLQTKASLDEIIGTSLKIDPFNSLKREISCIPLPHPSGRSVWNQTHKTRVQGALALLRKTAL